MAKKKTTAPEGGPPLTERPELIPVGAPVPDAPAAPPLQQVARLMLDELQEDFLPVAAKLDICEALLKRYPTSSTATSSLTTEDEAVQNAIAYLWRIADRSAKPGVLVESKRDRARSMAILLHAGL